MKPCDVGNKLITTSVAQGSLNLVRMNAYVSILWLLGTRAWEVRPSGQNRS